MRPSPFHPEPIDVYTTDNLPVRVNFKKKIQKVQEITNFWRVDDGWWAKPVSRTYYALELEGCIRITVFYDCMSNKWYKQNWTT